MARVKRRPGIGRVTRYCVPVAAASGPTVILNAAYATDTLLDQGLVPITEGGELDSWAMATGGTYSYGTAFLAGASARPIYVAASGVHTAGNNAALTCVTPVTIPADTDCVIYVKANLSAYETSGAMLGIASTASTRLEIVVGDTELGHNIGITFGAVGQVSLELSATVTGVYLFRLTRASGVWSVAATGVASAAMNVSGTIAGALSFDTLLAYSTAGSGLTAFAASGLYLQKVYIFHGSSTPDTAYETANGGVLS